MKVPLQWLADHLAELPPLAELSARLSLAGDKVEGVERRGLPDVDGVQALDMPHRTSSHKAVTVSVGVACTRPNDTQRPGDLIEAADAALYAAKHRGRNTVVEHGFVRITDMVGGVAMAS